MTDLTKTDTRNLLLASLPPAEFARIAESLDTIPMKLKDVIQKAGQPVAYVYFPGGGFVSVIAVLEDGNMVEVGTTGCEGAACVLGALDNGLSPTDTMVQGEAGVCYRMPAAIFRREMERAGPFFQAVMRYQAAFTALVMQVTACNAVHSVEQRLARWLLMAQDHLRESEFALTQEFAAMMLGATRPTVTIVAGTLQRAGLITYRRGRVQIVDRERLEEASCE